MERIRHASSGAIIHLHSVISSIVLNSTGGLRKRIREIVGTLVFPSFAKEGNRHSIPDAVKRHWVSVMQNRRAPIINQSEFIRTLSRRRHLLVTLCHRGGHFRD